MVWQEASFCSLECFRKFHKRLSVEERIGDRWSRTGRREAQTGPGSGRRTGHGAAPQGPPQHSEQDTRGNASSQQFSVTGVLQSSALPRPAVLGSAASEALSFPPGLALQRPALVNGEGYGTPLQYSCLENPMDGGAWCAAVNGVTSSRTRLSDFTFTFHFHALEKEMATHSSVLAWRIPGMGEPGGLSSMGLHRVGHD